MSSNTLLKRKWMEDLKGLTFFMDYENHGVLQGINGMSAGNGTPTFTWDSTNSARTIVGSDGIIRLANDTNTPRFVGGYWANSGGFNKLNGLLIEGARTNLALRTDGTSYGSGIWTTYAVSGNKTGTAVTTNNPVTDLTSITGAMSQRVQYTGVAGDVPDKTCGLESALIGVINQNDVITVSFWARSLTGNSGVVIRPYVPSYTAGDVYISDYFGADIAGSLTTSWKFFQKAFTITDATVGKIKATWVATGIGDGDKVDVEIYGFQVEKAGFASSFIPTSTTTVTRNAEVLKYLIDSNLNRTPASETMVIKCVPFGGDFANDGLTRTVMSTDTKRRYILKIGAGNVFSAWPNVQDNGAHTASGAGIVPVVGTPYVVAAVFKHSSPYSEIYIDGVSKGTYTAADFTDNAWGTYFYVGCSQDTQNASVIVQSVAIFSDAKTVDGVKRITEIMQLS